MVWEVRNRADKDCLKLADRHYNRQKIRTPQFVPPGRCLVLYTENESGKAFWVTSFQYPEYVKHDWPNAWVCSAFRNEGAGLSSDLILQAIAVTHAHFGEPPENGMITFINRDKVKPTMVHGEKTWGFVYRKAGFEYVGETGSGLMCLQLRKDKMPKAEYANNTQLSFAV